MLMLVDLGQEPGNDLARLGLDHGRLAEVELAGGDGVAAGNGLDHERPAALAD